MRRPIKVITLLVALSLLFVATQNCSGFSTRKNSILESTELPPGEISGEPFLTRSDFLTGLNQPWDLAFAQDGTLFFTERCNGLFVRHKNGQVVKLFGTSGAALSAPDLFCEGQSGMHGVALAPDFSTSQTIFVYMASNLRINPRTNRVVRLVANEALTSVSNRTDIISDINYKDVANKWGGAGSHSGGRLKFGADGFLYVTTGDNHNGTLPQDLTQLGGKVLRVDQNGAPATGHNLPAGADPRIFSYGHRNVQGIAFRPGSEQPFISEHGPGHDDEVTALNPGGNGGWDPKPDPGVSCESNYCGYTSNNQDGVPTSMTDLKKFPSAMLPIWNNSAKSEGMGPCHFLNGSQWKLWDGRLLVGIMGGQRLELLELNTNGTLKSTKNVDLPKGRYRSLTQGPDGNLYVAIDSGSIWKVTPR